MHRMRLAPARVMAAALTVALGLPAPGHPQSRMPPMPSEQLSPEQRAAVAAFREARKAELTGPFIALLRSPEVLTRARAMGDYLRFTSRLAPKHSELVILMAARNWSQQYEWAVHYPIAIKAGVSVETARAVAERRRPADVSGSDAVLYDFCDELLRTQAVGDATYARMVAAFGEPGVVDTVGILGYYTMLAMMLNTARIPAPASDVPPLPVIAEAPAAGSSGSRPAAAAVAPPAAYAGLRDGFADVPGARLFFVDSGGPGPAVVLLHAATGSSQSWEHQLPAFTAAGYRVIAYDRRGHGRTTVTAGGPVATAADDLDALLTTLAIDRAVVVGTAAGGIVATDFALAFGPRVRSLVVANSLVGVQDAEYVALGRRLRPPAFSALPADMRELSPTYRAANAEGTARWLALEHASRAPGPPPAPQPPKSRVTFAALEALTVPTLLITGESDLYTPPPVLPLFATRLPRVETLVLHDAAHAAYWETPEAFNRAVLDFLARHK